MLSSYLKVGARNLTREKSYSLINIAGLTAGIACCLVLGLYVSYQLSFDRHHEKHERIFRVVNEYRINDSADYASVTSTQLAPLLQEQYAEVEQAVRFQTMPAPRYLLRSDYEQAFYWERLLLTENNVFDIFDHEIIHGNPETALIDPSSMAVSESLARRYFGDANPIGETLYTDVSTYQIDLVFADLPDNSHMQYDALLSYNRLPQPDSDERLEQLWNISNYTYVLMPAGYQPEQFRTISDSFFETNMAPLAQQMGVDGQVDFFLEPLADVHLTSTTIYDLPRGNIFFVYAFAAIAFFVLAVASINYMNLATARSTKRAREVGMRKVLGASRGQLIGQFVGESAFYTLLSLLLALLVCGALLRFTPLSALLGAPLTMQPLFSPPVFSSLLLGALALGVLSGLYPAFYLSSMPPIAAFRGAGGTRKAGTSLRKMLVTVQFAISVTVVACTLLMLAQMQFINSKELGFDDQNRIVLRVAGADQVERLPALINELEQQPGVLAAGRTQHLPGQNVGLNAIQVENDEGVMQQRTLNVMNVRPGLIDTLGLTLLAGRDLDENRPNDRNNVLLVNQTLVDTMGWVEPLGKRMQQFGPNAPEMEVVGVVEDFHYAGLQQQVEPLFMAYWEPDFSEMDALNRGTYSEQLIVSVAPGSVQPTIDFLRERWISFDPDHPFEFTFLDQDLDALYGSEQRMMQLVGIFSLVCIVISCLGLYGLSAFNTAQRTKEIGVRKVLGASTRGIILLLFRSVLALICLAAVLATVVSFFVISQWLSGFYYRIELLGINALLFLVAAALAMVVAFATMAAQSFRTAQASPIRALRYE